MKTITTTLFAENLAALDHEWLIVAIGSPWVYEIPDGEVYTMQAGVEDGRISTVTGMVGGQRVLYARLPPVPAARYRRA